MEGNALRICRPQLAAPPHLTGLGTGHYRLTLKVKAPRFMPEHLHSLPAVGRFAPSPTGPLHFWLAGDGGALRLARQGGGRWLLRIEDPDMPRVVPMQLKRSCEPGGVESGGMEALAEPAHPSL
jgi:hypothetical protein